MVTRHSETQNERQRERERREDFAVLIIGLCIAFAVISGLMLLKFVAEGARSELNASSNLATAFAQFTSMLGIFILSIALALGLSAGRKESVSRRHVRHFLVPMGGACLVMAIVGNLMAPAGIPVLRGTALIGDFVMFFAAAAQIYRGSRDP